jgi:hypothetical protein
MGYIKNVDGSRIMALRELALGRIAFTRIDDGSEIMNIDGRAAGSPVNLWNGTGVDDTGSDWTVSGTGSETAESKKNGTNGWDTGVADKSTMTVFDYGSMTDIDGYYSSLDFWIQPKAYPGQGMRIRWVDDNNDQVGGQVWVDDYVDNMDLDSWKFVSIPIDDFNLDGYDVQKLQFRYRKVAGQRYWFDDISIISAAAGGPYKFRIVAPDANTRYHLSMAVVLISAPEDGWNSSSFANISDGLLRGMIMRHKRLSTGDTLWKFTTKNNIQLFGQFHPQESFAFADNKLLVGFMVKPGKASVIITDDDVLEFVVRDDLRDITEMRAFCHYGVEDVTND